MKTPVVFGLLAILTFAAVAQSVDPARQVRPPSPSSRSVEEKGVGQRKDPTSVVPVPREDPGWRERFELLNERCRSGPELVLLGDSITEAWESAGKAAWDKRFAARNAINLGIGGDRTQHVLWRLRNGHLAGLTGEGSDSASRPAPPKLVVLMIGTNNSNGADNTSEEIGQGIEAIVRELRSKLPSTQVLIFAIFPRGEKPDAQRAKNAEASRLASRLADGKMVHFLDIGEKFLAPDGTLPGEVMPDYLHLSRAGYDIWAEALEAWLKAHRL